MEGRKYRIRRIRDKSSPIKRPRWAARRTKTNKQKQLSKTKKDETYRKKISKIFQKENTVQRVKYIIYQTSEQCIRYRKSGENSFKIFKDVEPRISYSAKVLFTSKNAKRNGYWMPQRCFEACEVTKVLTYKISLSELLDICQ